MHRIRAESIARHAIRVVTLWLMGMIVAWVIGWGVALGTEIADPARFACDAVPREYHRGDLGLRTIRACVAVRNGVGYEYYFTLLEHRKVLNSMAPRAGGTGVAEILPAWVRPKVAPWQVGAAWPHGDKRSMQGLLAVGWPRRSMYAIYTSHRQAGTLHPHIGGIELSGTTFAGVNLTRTLPFLPIWSGLLINATMYATVIGIAWFVARATVRMRRCGCQRCVACGYELGALPLARSCPECGTLFSRQASH